jgi:hypothetical protein
MDNVKIKAWWASLGLDPAQPSTHDADFGDMGTAFGLDATFGPSERDTQEKGRTNDGAPLTDLGFRKPRPA